MPTLELFTCPSNASASHAVRAPGGYEWWHFIAEDPASDRRIVVSFFDGFPFHPGYVGCYQGYVSHSTRCRPPVPAEFPAVQFAFYEQDRVVARFLCAPSARELVATENSTELLIGQSRMKVDSSGAISLEIRGTPWSSGTWGPRRGEQRTLSAEVTFTPRWSVSSPEQSFGSEAGAAGKQHWLVTHPACDVRGAVHVYGQDERPPIDMEFSGRGYHDHYFGTAPLAGEMNRWMSATLFDDESTTVLRLEDEEGEAAIEGQVIQFTSGREQILDAGKMRIAWPRGVFGVGVPQEIEFGEDTQLSNPRVLCASPFDTHVLYDAQWQGKSRTALCEFAKPGRLRSPIQRVVAQQWVNQANDHVTR
ncbi:MAG TPA: hypothetical protein VL282_15930 [Tepidisphaeraceae bacterium]|jgi:hypothetical protein|nr:hypothetical protein [Tepidisphaeraceae bacterium]